MITLKVCLLVWVVSVRTVAFHVLVTWRESRIFGFAPSVGTLQAFGDGKQQRITGTPKVSALRPPSGVDRAFALFKSLQPLQDNALIEKATATMREAVDTQMKTMNIPLQKHQLGKAFTELEEKYLNSEATSSFLEKLGEVYEMGLPQVMKVWKNAYEAVIAGIGVSPSIKLAYVGSAATAGAYTARTAHFGTSANRTTAVGSLKLDSQHVVPKQQRESSVSSKDNESSESVVEVKTHIVDLQRPSTVENVISGLQKQAVNSYKELDNNDDVGGDEENSANRMTAVATKIEKDLNRILESCQQHPSRLPADQKKELVAAIKKLKDVGLNQLQAKKKIDTTAHMGVWSLVYVNKERALNEALGGLLARLTCIRSPITQIVEPNGTLVNEAQVQLRFMPFFHWLVQQRCTVKKEGEKTVVIHNRHGFGIGPFRIFGKVRRAEMNLSYVGSQWKVSCTHSSLSDTLYSTQY
eukprot:343830_1